jgi:hypothetical protein
MPRAQSKEISMKWSIPTRTEKGDARRKRPEEREKKRKRVKEEKRLEN